MGEMSKLIMIHTIAKFRHAYAVRVDDDAVPEVIAGKLIASEDQEDLYQTFCGERYETAYDITEEDVVKVFDTEHHYIKDLPKERKLAYIRDYRTVKDVE